MPFDDLRADRPGTDKIETRHRARLNKQTNKLNGPKFRAQTLDENKKHPWGEGEVQGQNLKFFLFWYMS